MKSKLLILASLALVLTWIPSQSWGQPETAPAAETKASAPAAPGISSSAAPAEPKDLDAAVTAGKDAVAAAQSGQWWYFSSIVCLIIMFVLKAAKILKKLGRWRYVVLPLLSIASALLAAFQGGVGWSQAIGVFGSSWSMGMLQELVSHGILGKPHESTGASNS